jgi:hypothetical protein
MAVEFVTFQKFSDKESAGQLAALLEKHQVECILEDNSSSLDATFGSQAFENNYAVKIRQADFEKVNHILIEDSIADLDAIDKDYYLFSFTDDELRDILAHRDEWNAFDFILAQKLLKRRGSEVSEEQLDDLKQQRIVELSQPEPTQTAWITAGYIMAFMGGLLGIFIGWFLSSHKKRCLMAIAFSITVTLIASTDEIFFISESFSSFFGICYGFLDCRFLMDFIINGYATTIPA